MNPFQYDYDHRLREWKILRRTIDGMPLDEACVEVDTWWQQTPIVNHHIHPFDIESWPDPWDMLSENTYSTLTRALGMCYTLLMSSVPDIKLYQATDIYGDEYDLVVAGYAKYVLNYHPNTVLSNSFADFKVIRELNLEPIHKNIR